MENKNKQNKTRGWANLSKQLEEVRTESFKQGIWKGRQEARKERIDDEIKFLENEEWHLNKEYSSLPLEPKHIRQEIKVTINNIRNRIK